MATATKLEPPARFWGMKDFKSRRKGEGDAESAFKFASSSPRSKVGLVVEPHWSLLKNC